MAGRRYRIGVISSSESLRKAARSLANKADDLILIHAYSQGMEAAIPLGREMEQKGIEAIVARGGTSHLLRENLSIPLLSVPLSSLDILEAVQRAVKEGRKRIFFPVFRHSISGIEKFEKLFDIKLSQGVFESGDELRKIVKTAADEGYDYVIGGSLTRRVAIEYGLKGVEIETPREIVKSMLEEAKSIINLKREDQKKTQRYQSVIDAASEGIIAVDNSGVITNINKTARRITQFVTGSVVGEHIGAIIPNAQILEVLASKRPRVNRMEEVNGVQFLGSHFPIKLGDDAVGGVSIYRDIPTVLRAEDEVRRTFTKRLVAKYSIHDIVYKSRPMEEVIRKVRNYAKASSTVLIYGETGTGKELVAHSIHNLGRAKHGPFVSMNCAALPEQLLESELFGYEEGSFTGARRHGKAGLFEIADKGTIFLDDIGSTTLNFQARLLRVLQEKEIMRIGGDYLIPINVRVIASTNKNLVEEVKTGRMREDLFFRLNVLNIRVPALRERKEDIPPLVDALARRVANVENVEPMKVPREYIERLMEYDWPGNVRQLCNFVEGIVLLSKSKFSPAIFEKMYEQLIQYRSGSAGASSLRDVSRASGVRGNTSRARTTIEREEILDTLNQMKYRRGLTARKLGISRTTLWRRIKDMNIG